MFLFSWFGIIEISKFHLSSWEIVYLPRCLGGWGIKHLKKFNLSLCVKNLWQCMFNTGLWRNLVKSKYLKGLDHTLSFRGYIKNKSSHSKIWSSFMNFFPVVNHGLSWSTSRGIQIYIGIDPICGWKVTRNSQGS